MTVSFMYVVALAYSDHGILMISVVARAWAHGRANVDVRYEFG